MNDTGKLIIISGPSGVGKSTVVSQLIATCPLPLRLSISATTRPIRKNDIPGRNYIFLSNEEFQRKAENGEFLEYVEVFGQGFWYGTLRDQVTTGLNSGHWIILEIDVEGAQQIKTAFPDALGIFIHPGSLEELERRLRGRATDNGPAIARRLEVARRELAASVDYEHIIINQSLDQTVSDICQLLVKSSDSQMQNS